MAPHQSKQPDEPVIRRSRTLDGHCQGLLPGMVCIFAPTLSGFSTNTRKLSLETHHQRLSSLWSSDSLRHAKNPKLDSAPLAWLSRSAACRRDQNLRSTTDSVSRNLRFEQSSGEAPLGWERSLAPRPG